MPNGNDMLTETYRAQVERWNRRRDIEWRLTLTLWSTILITTFAIAGKIQPHWVVILIIYMALFGAYLFWIVNLWKRNDFDKKWMYKYQTKINEELSIIGNVTPDNAPKHALEDWSMLSQLLFAFILLTVSGLILHYTPESESTLFSFIKMLIR